MRLFLTFLAFSICLAAPASAVTWKIQVTGSIDTMTFQSVERFDPLTGDLTDVGSITYYIDDPILDTFLSSSYLASLRSSAGISFYDSDAFDYRDGSGILRTLNGLSVRFGLGDHFAGGGVNSILTTTNIFYEDDGQYDWTASDGALLSTFRGSTYSGTVTSYSISTVPLPASAFFLAGGLFGLTFLRRRRA